ncbi:MAG: DUF4160 domain-containing protein [Desulfosarcina sp.]|nr:DUF4160 domain-containing protein [Desulfobacterales bacterium]
MPKIYVYLGIVILFYSNEHEPVHIHGKYQGRESKAELIIENGKVIDIIIKPVRGRKPLHANILKNFKIFVDIYSEKIVQKWIDYFVLHKKVICENIERRIK